MGELKHRASICGQILEVINKLMNFFLNHALISNGDQIWFGSLSQDVLNVRYIYAFLIPVIIISPTKLDFFYGSRASDSYLIEDLEK